MKRVVRASVHRQNSTAAQIANKPSNLTGALEGYKFAQSTLTDVAQICAVLYNGDRQ